MSQGEALDRRLSNWDLDFTQYLWGSRHHLGNLMVSNIGDLLCKSPETIYKIQMRRKKI
jgi:hypothetical protein